MKDLPKGTPPKGEFSCTHHKTATTPLDVPTFDMLQALAATAHAWVSATLVGSPAPVVRTMHTWLETYGLGDLIVEQSTFWRGESNVYAIGTLEKIERRMVCRHEHDDPNLEKCTECTGEERPDGTGWRRLEVYHWLRTAPDDQGRVRRRWYNANFIRIPRNAAELRQAKGR